jgi:hypothetical protein
LVEVVALYSITDHSSLNAHPSMDLPVLTRTEQVTPIYASSPSGSGGLEMTTSQLSIPLSVFGVSLLLFAVFGFRRVERLLGVRPLARAGLFLSVVAWMLHPVASLAMPNETAAMAILCVAHVGKAVSQTSTFTSAMVLINVTAPNGQLGRVNGMGQSIASFVRGAGPAIGGYVWALTLGTGLPGHQFIVYSGLALTSLATVTLYGPHLRIPALDGPS